MKLYKINGLIFQFDENDVPEGAVEVKAAEPKENKAAKPSNKVKAVKSK